MYSVDHLVHQHQKQMDKLSRQQEKAARKREKQSLRLEDAFSRLREEVTQTVCQETGVVVPALDKGARPARFGGSRTARWSFMHTLRSLLF
ncbi:hypothetical protein [Desulfovibrio psychrotolerans]|uniref:Uncharacterized protein n=1 Tax=Desulfovibrio psychrotolerans TaxID=415242 RepID=A0A7J0BV16_9BACT|nr:hypothetical protein [Desulfovibrio psychrotolerans]GFM36854.1 hypothetical protein DSM19430T_15380 [Desulfovibrio psychrotolerans]